MHPQDQAEQDQYTVTTKLRFEFGRCTAGKPRHRWTIRVPEIGEILSDGRSGRIDRTAGAAVARGLEPVRGRSRIRDRIAVLGHVLFLTQENVLKGMTKRDDRFGRIRMPATQKIHFPGLWG